MISSKIKSWDSIVLFLAIVGLGLLNSAKHIESDLILYQKQFLLNETLDFVSYLLVNRKDFGYYVLNFLVYRLISEDFRDFLFLHSCLSYYLFYTGSKRLATYFNISSRLRMSVFIFLILLPMLFSFSAHILRQFLAIAIGYYSISYLNERRGLATVVLLLSCLIHSSNIVFLPILAFNSRAGILNASVIAAILFFAKGFISEYVPGLDRINSLDGGAELEAISMITKLSVLLFLIVSVYFLWRNRESDKRQVIFLLVILHFLVLSFDFYNFSELSTRFLPNIYVFWPLLISLTIDRFKERDLLKLCFTFTLSILFVFNIVTGTWSYF